MLDVVADDALGKQNCLKMVTRDRTYFMFASSGQEAEEWIRIIKWKLVCDDHGHNCVTDYLLDINVPTERSVQNAEWHISVIVENLHGIVAS